MKKFTFLIIALLAIAGYAKAEVDASIATKKVTEVGAATTTIDTNAWYLLYNQKRGCYVSEETNAFMMRVTSNFEAPVAAADKAGYLYQFESTGNDNEYYIKSGNGLYFMINDGSSTVSTEPVAYTIAQIGDNAGHFYGVMVSDGRVLDGNGAGGTLAGWGTTIPTSTGGNNDYQFLPVTMEEASYIDVTYNFTYNNEVKYTQTSAVEEGSDFPDYTVTLPYGVTAAAKPTDKVSAENATQNIELTVTVSDLPFTASTLESDGSFGENMHWYTLTLRGNDLTYNAASNKSISADVATKTLANFYAFTGNPFDGYKLFNYVAGSSKIAWSATVDDSGTAIPFTELSQVTDNTDWMLFQNGEAWTLRREDNSNGYINERYGALSYWTSSYAATDPGSRLTIDEVTTEVLTEIVTNYKTTTIATLEEWATLSVVFDAELIATAKAAVEAVEVSGMGTFAEIDSKLTDVTNAVAAKMFTFQTTATDDGRNGVWVSANASTAKAIGADAQDYNAIWSLRHAGGTSFYLFNELNQVYMGAPSSNCPLTAEPVSAYTFEIVDATQNIVEMKCGGETLHASNHSDNKLLNYDENEAASRWYINTIDVASDIQDILDTITEDDYAEVPALGQYPKTAYDALVEARTSATTVEAVEAAIAAFKLSKNVPVYFITNAYTDYAAGCAIYYDGAWKWKKANKYDKQMWMTIPSYTEENIPTVDSYDAANTYYEICDYLTGTVMRGKKVQIVTIDGWDGAYNLQYGTTTNDAVQHAASGGALVGWNAATTDGNQNSAWNVEYIGTSYELSQLTDEHITALTALQTAYNAKAYFAGMVEGTGIGQYVSVDEEAIANTINTASTIINKTLVQQATTPVADITAATEALNALVAPAMNMPTEGKYYRIKGACEAALKGYYITGNTNADGGRIACAENGDDASTIYYYADGKLLSYSKGHYIALNATAWTFGDASAASAIVFAASSNVAGAYSIKSATHYLHYTVYNGTVEVNRCSAYNADKNHDWYLEEVTELPVTITAAGYATFYAPVDVTYDGIEAYYTIGEVKDEKYLQLVDFEGTIPATDGAILKGDEGTYNLTISSGAEKKENNKLTGTAATTVISKVDANSYYILGRDTNGNVGLYNPINGENTDVFTNTGHKAYMLIEGAAQTIGYSFNFDWNGTTGIENIEDAVEENTTKAIYDITGRQIKAITVPGIYIINGKKTFVK